MGTHDRSGLRERFRGSLLGAAAGDALGAPFEGAHRVDQAAVDRVLGGEGRLHYTDDTHMTIGVAVSLLERGGLDGAHMAATFARRFAEEPWRGYGAGPPKIFRMLDDGVPWDEAAARLFGGSGSFGNGGAMRVAPVGLAFHRDLPTVDRLARETARITHAHPLGTEGAALQAVAVALALSGDADAPLDAASFVDAVGRYASEPVYREQLDRVAGLLPDAEPETVARAVGNGIAAHEAVPAALCAFLANPDSMLGAVRFAVMLGGDTDTIASMAGALAGARLGEGALPGVWRRGVEGADELCSLGNALYGAFAGAR